MAYVKERRKTEVIKEYDVAVCGGGFAGISAALASARQGKKTVLFEKQYILGGLGTAGIVTIYLPLCDGVGHQVTYGIAEELLRLSVLHGAEAIYPDNWLDREGPRGKVDKRFEVQYNPQIFAILSEKLLADSGVDILYGTYVVDVRAKKGKITHLITENKSGRQAYKVGSVVDSTGDCDIAKFSGAPTKLFEQGNVLAAWYYSLGNKGYRLHMHGYADIPDDEKTSENAPPTLSDRRFSGLSGEELSIQMQLSHRSTYDDLMERRKDDPGLMPVTIAATPQVRMTRKIVGEYELSHTEEHKYFEDSIGMIANWKKRGPVYEVPFGTLFSSKVKNLICAGRCTSVGEAMWDIMRVIPCCALTGQAAGTAAAMSDDFSKLDVKKLQSVLISDGVILHEKDIDMKQE